MAARVVVHEAAFRALETGPEIRGAIGNAGEQVASRAQSLAPKRTGAGAASIHSEVAQDGDAVAARISWDSAHDYMQFHEFGTSVMPASPFLRPALDGPVSL